MAIVRYCLLDGTNTCTDVIQWDNTYTYYPPSGKIIAGDNTGEVGWYYANGATAGGTWTTPGYGSAPGVVTDPIAVVDGGTGASTLTGLIKGNGISAFTAAVAGTDYLAPAAIGSTVQAWDGDLDAIAALSGTSGLLRKSAANTWALDTATYLTSAVTTFSGGTTGLTPASASSGAVSLGGTLVVANGGTGATTLTGLVKGNGASAFTAAVAGTDYVSPSSYASGIATFLGTPSSTNLRSAITDETGTGSLVFATQPTLTGLNETRVAVAASAIDCATGAYFTKTATGALTWTVSNVPTAGLGFSLILDLTNGGLGTQTWWTGVKWAGGTAPTLTSAGRDVLGFFTHDGGTTWSGFVLGQDVK